MGCEQVRLLLEERVGACGGEVDRLRVELERISGLVAAREEESARLTTALEVVAALPVAHPAPPTTGAVAAIACARSAPVGGVVVRADAAAVFTERVLGVLAGFAGPVRCRQVVEGLGLEVTARDVERVRHHLKNAAAAGRVVRTPGGLFTLARGRVAAGG